MHTTAVKGQSAQGDKDLTESHPQPRRQRNSEVSSEGCANVCGGALVPLRVSMSAVIMPSRAAPVRARRREKTARAAPEETESRIYITVVVVAKGQWCSCCGKRVSPPKVIKISENAVRKHHCNDTSRTAHARSKLSTFTIIQQVLSFRFFVFGEYLWPYDMIKRSYTTALCCTRCCTLLRSNELFPFAF